ncbi:hypothetical protein H4R20_000487 [Coemansia guatemalensis]|uniref:B-block binding subunit of TFIIIC domain-containing protein n=1 Tax=Coemansia guatemalensis TaxID=2761395 RepID=A0A9W8HZ46_9FUNG|nr:hypothetical protein H4R20_000487 [Coemansia guatemalensis]
MDDILQTIKKEVTLDGVEGSTLSRVWDYADLGQRRLLEKNGVNSEGASADSALRAYLWPHIARIPSLIFLNRDKTILDNTDPESADSKEAKKFLKLGISELEKKYPELVVRASQSAIYKLIFGREEGIDRVISSQGAMKLLMCLMRAREKGVTQNRLAKDNQIDPRAAFYFLKVLDNYGLTVKHRTFDEGCNTNLLILRMFTPEAKEGGDVYRSVPSTGAKDSGKGDDEDAMDIDRPQFSTTNAKSEIAKLVQSGLRTRICELLSSTDSGYMIETDLIDGVGLDIWKESHLVYYRRVIRSLRDKGYVEIVRVQVPEPSLNHASSDSASSAEENADAGSQSTKVKQVRIGKKMGVSGKKHKELRHGYSYRRCIRFIKPYVDIGKVRASVGIPKHAKQRANIGATQESRAAESNQPNISAEEEEEDILESSDDDVVDIDAARVKEDIKHILSRPQVQIGMLASLPLDMQLFRLIALAGTHGIVLHALCYFLKGIGYRMIDRAVNRLATTPVFTQDGGFPGMVISEEEKAQNLTRLDEMLVVRVDECIGREHRRRLFANPLAQPLFSRLIVDYTQDVGVDSSIVDIPDNSVVAEAAEVAEDPAAAAADTESATNIEQATDAAESIGEGAADQQQELQVANPITDQDELLLNECGDIEDVLVEAKERRISINWAIRERVILRLLEHENYFMCSQTTSMRCDDLIKKYFQRHIGSTVLTSAMMASVQRYRMDKRTLLRAVESLSADNKLWYRTVDLSLTNISSRESSIARIAIARSANPDEPLIKSIINQLSDMRSTNTGVFPTAPRTIQDDIVVQRPEGAEAREKEIVRRLRQNRNELSAHDEGSGVNNRKRPSSVSSYVLAKRARVMLKSSRAESSADADWANVFKRMKQPSFRIGRMVDLLAYLVENLPQNIDDKFVYQNYVFRTSFLFSRLPLELFIELNGGIMFMPQLLLYIKDGTFPTDDGADVDIDGEHRQGGSTIEDINRRLATPIDQLPESLRMGMRDLLSRTRSRIQALLLGLQVLQLIRPIHSAKDIICMPEPPDARDAFRSVYVGNPRVLSFGYQVVSKARLLTAEGYSALLNAWEKNVHGPIDLTGYYLNDEEYDLLTPMGLFRYLSDLEMSARTLATELPNDHALYGIGDTRNWQRPVILRASQTEILNNFVDMQKCETPLGNTERLREAALRAETTLEETRRYFQHAHVRVLRAAARRASEQKRTERIREKVREARAALAEKRARILESRKEAEKNKKKRRAWSEEESQKVAIYYAVMAFHARQHCHPFLLRNVIGIFPSRGHTHNPAESVRHHQTKMYNDPQMRTQVSNISAIWKYVLRDAIMKGELTDEPDIDLFDPKPQVEYFANLIKEESLDGLVQKYADELASEDESNYMTGITGVSDLRRRLPRGQGRDSSKRKLVLGTSFSASRDCLPATMKGVEDQFAISYIYPKNRGPLSRQFEEDSYNAGLLSSRSQRPSAYGEMLTTHSEYRCMVDYSNPITTRLSMPSGERADDASGASEMLQNSEVITGDASALSYPDMMSTMWPLTRNFDATVLAEKIEALALDGGSSETDDAASERTALCSSESDYSNAKSYAEVASLQAVIMNLTLTPQQEYSVKTGHQLLSLKEAASTKALELLYRQSSITRLRGMASSIGLSTASGHDKGDSDATPAQEHAEDDETTEPQNSVSEPQSEIGGTVLVHETTGTTRMTAKIGNVAGSQHVEAADDGDNSVNTTDGGENTNAERRVPGRGFSASEKFLGTIFTSLPDRFLEPDLSKLHKCGELNEYLEPSEFGYMCSLIGESKLWLRPSYGALSDKPIHALAGFRRAEHLDIAEFAVNAIVDQDSGPMDVDRSMSAGDAIHSKEVAVASAGLSGKPLATAMRFVLGIVSAMGPLGASAYELARLFDALSQGSAKASFSKLSKNVQSALHSDKRMGALLNLLALKEKVYAVGSNDVRFVSAKIYHKHWALSLDGSDIVFAPRLGQNLSGSVNKTFTWGMLTSLLGHIISNPGISQTTIVRRYFAPHIPKFEVLHYLDALRNLGIIYAETDVETGMASCGPPYPLEATYYYMAPGYYAKLAGVPQCSALSNLHVLQ